MSNKKVDWSTLQQFLPHNTFTFVNDLLNEYAIKMIVTKPRKHVLGYYKPPTKINPKHTITVNGNLSKYAFFIVLVHEIAHLKTFILYKNTVAGHGIEWKKIYSDLLQQTLLLNCYPADLEEIIQKKATHFASLRSCTDDDILRVLKKYETNPKKDTFFPVENIGVGGRFLHKGNSFYVKEKRRTRFLCIQQNSNQEYLFHSLMEVEKMI